MQLVPGCCGDARTEHRLMAMSYSCWTGIFEEVAESWVDGSEQWVDQLTLRLVVADVTLSKCVFVAVIFISLYTLTFLTIVAVTDSLTNRLQHWLLDWVPASGRYIGCLVGCLRLERVGPRQALRCRSMCRWNMELAYQLICCGCALLIGR